MEHMWRAAHIQVEAASKGGVLVAEATQLQQRLWVWVWVGGVQQGKCRGRPGVRLKAMQKVLYVACTPAQAGLTEKV
jgi:hypothetical protein